MLWCDLGANSDRSRERTFAGRIAFTGDIEIGIMNLFIIAARIVIRNEPDRHARRAAGDMMEVYLTCLDHAQNQG